MRALFSTLLAFAVLAASAPSPASATCFCMMRMPPSPTQQERGIALDPSYNPASAVVLVRDGRRTVLTIEAAYQGPAVELSLVVPIPSAIGRENVRTVSGTVFRRLDQRTAPRVRHMFPPCPPRPMSRAAAMGEGGGTSAGFGDGRTEAERVMDEFGVEIQDEWPVDEYDVTLLGADQSTGLLAFLRERGLELPDASATMLRGYIESGHRFVLFRADPSRAQRLGDQMMLSPIQLEYESDELRVPVRLGTLNSPGEQEILLYILSPDGRYDVANRPAVMAPTDLRMRRDARGSFAELYTAITDEVFRQTPGAAITEYAHPVGTHVRWADVAPFGVERHALGAGGRGLRPGGAGLPGRPWTVSRIRHRYGTNLADDLTLRQAEPARLTRRWSRWPQLRVRAREGQSAFHVQYVVEHSRCVSEQAQRAIARRFATAESMWESRHDLWPGEIVLDPIESLGIEPGSSAPPNWPPPPAPPPPTTRSLVGATAGNDSVAGGTLGVPGQATPTQGQATSTQATSTPSAPAVNAPVGAAPAPVTGRRQALGNTPAASAEEPGGLGCAAQRSRHHASSWLGGVAIVAAALTRRRRRRA